MRRSLLLLLTYLTSLQAFGYSIIPSKTDQPLFYLYKFFTIDQNTKTVKVNGLQVTSVIGDEASISATGNAQTINLDTFMFFRRYSPAIFTALTGHGDAVGTAFLVANNLILTNKHVADTDNTKKECGKFSITTNTSSAEVIACKKVLYCDKQDFCLIEINQTKSGKSLGEVVKPLIFTNRNIAYTKANVYSISNVRGLGIQAGQGHGLKYSTEYGGLQLEHNAPTLKGSSGSPILNDNGYIIGINYAESGSEYGETGNNWAVPTYYILSQLKKNLPVEIYNQFKTADPNTANPGDQAYEKLWLASYEKFANMQVYSNEEVLKCISEDHIANCLKSFEQKIEEAKKAMSGLSKSEQELILANPLEQLKVVNEIQKIMAIKESYALDSYEKNCQASNDLSFECVKEEFITISLFRVQSINLWLGTLDDSLKDKMFKAIVTNSKLANSFYRHDGLRILESDRELVGKVFIQCLAEVKTISSSYDGWLGESSEIGYDELCAKSIAKTVKGSKYKLPNVSDEELLTSIRLAMSNFKFSETFRLTVVKKWEYFILHLLETRDDRKANNIALIESWLKENKLNFKAEDIFLTIQHKMRLL